MKMFNRLTALITLFLYCFTGFADQTQTNTLSIGKPNSDNKSIIFQKSGNKPVIRMNGTTGVLQFSNDGTNFKDIGSGGGGFKNFVTNFDIEADTSGYSAFKDAAATTPVDGTGGSPTTITLSKTTTVGEVLSQTGSLKVAKSAANGQGEGFSYDVTIDRGWFPGPATISFLQDTTHASYSAGDMVVCVYDKDLASLVVISGADVGSCKSVPKQKGLFQATFNMSTSDDYRVIWHVSTTNASAYNLFFDEVNFNPLLRTDGVAISDWSSYTPTGSFTTNTVYSGRWRRVGDLMEGQIYITFTGSPNAVTLTDIQIPTGYTIDTSKLAAGTNTDSNWVGGGHMLANTGTITYPLMVAYRSTTSVRAFLQNSSSTYDTLSSITNTQPSSLGASDTIQMSFRVPISQWSGSANIVNGPRIECAYSIATTTTAGATDTTSSNYKNDCGGVSFNSIDSTTGNNTTTYRVQFPTGVQQGDKIYLKVSDGSGNLQMLSASNTVKPLFNENTFYYGMGYSGVAGSSTLFDISFGNAGFRKTSGSYGVAGTAWSSIAAGTAKWVLVKESGVAANAYAEAIPGVSPGFVSHLGVLGRTNGVATTAGYVGETISYSTSSDVNGSSSNNTYTTAVSGSFTPGHWLLQAVCPVVAYATSTAATNKQALFTTSVAITDGSDSILARSYGNTGAVNSSIATPGVGIYSHHTTFHEVNISSNTTYKLRFAPLFIDSQGGTTSFSSVAQALGTNYPCYLKGIRLN